MALWENTIAFSLTVLRDLLNFENWRGGKRDSWWWHCPLSPSGYGPADIRVYYLYTSTCITSIGVDINISTVRFGGTSTRVYTRGILVYSCTSHMTFLLCCANPAFWIPCRAQYLCSALYREISQIAFISTGTVTRTTLEYW